MIDTGQTISIKEIDGQFVASIPKIGATVTGATKDEALYKAQQAIVARMIAEAEKRKNAERKRKQPT